MKQLFLILTLLISFSTTGFSQKDAKAKEILDKSSAVFNQAGGLSAYFTLNIKDVNSKTTESFDGEISIKGNKFYINTPENNIYFNGKTQWVYSKAFEEVNISEPSAQEVQAINPASIFEMYKKGCNYKYIGEKTDIKMRKVQEVELIPQNKKGDMSRILIQINKTDFMPVLFHIYYKNNIENIIHINSYKTKENLPDDLFSFDTKKYPGAEIIDIR